jgi:hypothetical protein
MSIGGAGGSPATVDILARQAILSGDKTATSSVLWDYPDGRLPLSAR